MGAVEAVAPLVTVERRIGADVHLVAPDPELLVVLLGQAEHVGEHLARDRDAVGGDEVDLAVAEVVEVHSSLQSFSM